MFLNGKVYQLAQIIRADNLMLVSVYLSGESGSISPTFQIRGSETEFFSKYQDQLEHYRKCSDAVSEEKFNSLLRKHTVE